jgi:hypothetical protein
LPAQYHQFLTTCCQIKLDKGLIRFHGERKCHTIMSEMPDKIKGKFLPGRTGKDARTSSLVNLFGTPWLNTLRCSSKLNGAGRFAQTRPPRSHQSATQGVSGRGKRRLVQTAWRRKPCQIYKGAYLLCVFLVEGEINFLINPC